jgi:predicted nucleic acid-binding Zn ribbon protein
MPFCPDCGTQVSEDTQFCPECGRQLAIEQAVKGKSKKRLAGIIVGCLIAIIVTVVIATQPPTPQELEPAIPAHFTTYTNELGLFSISYPSEWELALSKIEGVTQDLNDYWKGIKPERTVEESSVVFFAGVPYKTGYNPNVFIVVIPSDEGSWKLEDLVEAVVQQGLMKDGQEYREFSRYKSIVDGKEAILLEYEVTYPALGNWRALEMYMRDGRMLIKVACSVLPPKNFSEYEADLYAIVRSLRILK